MSKINQAVKSALNAIEDCKRRILMFDYAVQGIRRDSVAATDALFDNSVAIIQNRLYRKLNEAYSVLFMWGNIVPHEAMREAKKAAFERYLKENVAIMQYLDMNLESPDSWHSEEEEQFRAEIESSKDD